MNPHLKINDYFNTKLYFLIFCFVFLIWMVADSNAMACDSCGRECTRACGTKHFRTCCFNYLRKRSDPTFLKPSSAQSLLPSSELDTTPTFLINSLSDEQIYDPNVNYRVLEQILDDIRHDSKLLEIEVRKALNIRKAEYAEKKHRLQEQQQQGEHQEKQQNQQQQDLQQKEMDY